MSNITSRVRNHDVLTKFCGDKMWYEFIDEWPYDANILNSAKKFIGIAKIFTQACCYGSKPIVEISKDDLDFIYELGLLTQKAPAVIIKFRNKVAYIKLEHVNYGMGEVRNKPTYKIPIGEFRLCA